MLRRTDYAASPYYVIATIVIAKSNSTSWHIILMANYYDTSIATNYTYSVTSSIKTY